MDEILQALIYSYRFIVPVEWVADESGKSPLPRVVSIAPPRPAFEAVEDVVEKIPVDRFWAAPPSRTTESALIEIGLVLFIITLIVNGLSRLLIWSMARSGKAAPAAEPTPEVPAGAVAV